MKRLALLIAAALVALGLTATTATASTPTVTTSTGVVTHGSINTTNDTIGWLLTCPISHTLRDDPIVHPGAPGTSHSHDFYGNASTNAFSTYASMTAAANIVGNDSYNGGQAQAGTSCGVDTYLPGTVTDTGGYWAPTLLINGTPFTPQVKAQLYYRLKPNFAANGKVAPFPADARLIVGDHDATSAATNPAIVAGNIYWEDANGNKTSTMPQTGTSMLLNVIFPQCWEGKPLRHAGPDGTDNNQFSYVGANNACPAAFPVPVPQLSEKFKYDNIPAGTRTLSSGAWYTIHADFWNTWQQTALKYLVDRCINAAGGGVSCGTNPIAPATGFTGTSTAGITYIDGVPTALSPALKASGALLYGAYARYAQANGQSYFGIDDTCDAFAVPGDEQIAYEVGRDYGGCGEGFYDNVWRTGQPIA